MLCGHWSFLDLVLQVLPAVGLCTLLPWSGLLHCHPLFFSGRYMSLKVVRQLMVGLLLGIASLATLRYLHLFYFGSRTTSGRAWALSLSWPGLRPTIRRSTRFSEWVCRNPDSVYTKLTPFCLDEFRVRSDTYQHRLDANQLCWLPPHDSLLHHMQCICCRRAFLPFLIANFILH